jgi:thiamine pyrophosphate-dependent acetolactate synthase large subunit-like protein
MAASDSTMKRNTKRMNRFDLTTRLVAQLKNEEAVIGGIGNSNFDLWGAGKRPQNFYMLGSMGLASPIALGVALAQPKRRVFALEGDGSLLMQLGSLATIANLAPRNLAIIVWDNAMYQITGGQPTATAGKADLVEVARAAGIAQSAWASDEADFERLVARTLNEDGPWFIGARIDGQSPPRQTPREPVIIKDNFMRGLGIQPPSKG